MGERETAAGSKGESPSATLPTPRLSIFHLMLWTACSAVCLALIRAAIYAGLDVSQADAVIDTLSVFQGVVSGAVLTGAIVLVLSRVRNGPPMLRQPGHWCLFVSGIVNLLYAPVLVAILLPEEVASLDKFIVVFYTSIMLFPAITYALAARYNLALHWKILFVALAARPLTHYLCPWLGTSQVVPYTAGLLVAGAVLADSLVELAAGQRRDWLHWTGVTTLVARASFPWLWYIASWLARLNGLS